MSEYTCISTRQMRNNSTLLVVVYAAVHHNSDRNLLKTGELVSSLYKEYFMQNKRLHIPRVFFMSDTL